MTDVVTLRPATLADLAAVDALLAHSYPRLLGRDYPPSVRVLALPIIARAKPGLLGSGTYWVAAEADGRIVAAGGWVRVGSATAEVRHVVTAVDRVRRGIGSALMQRAMAQAQAAGIRRFDCLSTRTAVPFYASLGFHTVGSVDVTLRPGIVFPAVAMQRDL